MSVTARADALAARVAERELDQLIVGDLVNPGDSSSDASADLRWLTGFGGTSGLAIVGPEDRVFLTDFRYRERAEREVAGGFEWTVADVRLLPALAARLRGRVGFDDAATSVATLRKLERAIADAGSNAELVAVTAPVEELRRRKDPAEQEAIAAAAQLADRACLEVLERGLVGLSERAVAVAVEARMRELGAEPAFPTIVAAGSNGALPHAEPSEREIGPGEMVVWDMGARLDGYCSDGTRTFATGEPGDEEREAYELVLAAQRAGLAAVRPGVAGRDADRAAREVIEGAGRGDLFGHGVGHGVGLAVHEAPRLTPSSDDMLAEGDVVTVEPGIYLPGRFGVRIEDLVVITADGHRNLSSLPKELTVAT